MTNTNSYDCSYEKPLLEGIMDILRFMDGWTNRIGISSYVVEGDYSFEVPAAGL
jgi:hypothetical protein